MGRGGWWQSTGARGVGGLAPGTAQVAAGVKGPGNAAAAGGGSGAGHDDDDDDDVVVDDDDEAGVSAEEGVREGRGSHGEVLPPHGESGGVRLRGRGLAPPHLAVSKSGNSTGSPPGRQRFAGHAPKGLVR